ncbi:MAG: hypothetical protein ACYTGX_01335 [Planctomycetota bacterium]|jgi:hypothetical protein
MLVAVIALAGAAVAQEPEAAPPAPPAEAPARVRIVHKVHEGLVYSVEEIRRKQLRYTMGNVAGADGKAVEVPAEVERVSREAWTDTVRATAGGVPTRLERHYHARTAYERHKTTTQEVQLRRPLHGRTVELRTTDQGVRVKAMTGDELAAEDTAGLRLLPAVTAFLPAQPVAVGEQWRLDRRAVARLLGDGASAGTRISDAYAALREVRVETLKPGLRHRIAVLAVRFTIATTLRSDLVLTSTLRGTIRVDLTAEQLLRADLTGSLEAASDPSRLTGSEVTVELKGEVAIRVLVRPGRLDPGRPAPRGSGR